MLLEENAGVFGVSRYDRISHNELFKKIDEENLHEKEISMMEHLAKRNSYINIK